MSTVRMLPLGAPVAAGVASTAQGAAIVLAVLGLLLMLLAVHAIRLRGNGPAGDGGKGPPA